ncbi:MAG: antirestriction protein [Psychrobacter sp.]|nr:antirestriction protein [Psychrobacter sp.]
MPNTQTATHTQDFWSKLIVKKNVDLPDLPQKYRSDDGSFLIGLVKEYAQDLSEGDAEIFDDKWITAQTIDGAVFAYPDVDQYFNLVNRDNYGSAKDIDAKTFGLIASLMNYSIASFQFQTLNPELSHIMGNNYHILRNSFYSLLDVALYPDEIRETGDELQKERLALFANITKEQIAGLSHISDGIYSITN